MVLHGVIQRDLKVWFFMGSSTVTEGSVVPLNLKRSSDSFNLIFLHLKLVLIVCKCHYDVIEFTILADLTHMVFLRAPGRILFSSSCQCSPYRCLTNFRISMSPRATPGPPPPSMTLLILLFIHALWTPVWERCPTSCPNWDH